ncbi:MAG: formylmethanofuran dehydrogenase subunit B, partial [Methanosarcinales archaeon]
MVVCTCTGCAMLCEDIELIIENNEIKEIFSACRIGVSRFVNNRDRIESNKGIVNGETVDIDKAINKAKEILNNSENTLLFG